MYKHSMSTWPAIPPDANNTSANTRCCRLPTPYRHQPFAAAECGNTNIAKPLDTPYAAMPSKSLVSVGGFSCCFFTTKISSLVRWIFIFFQWYTITKMISSGEPSGFCRFSCRYISGGYSLSFYHQENWFSIILTVN